MDKTFISYSRRDLKFAQRLLNALHNRGIDPWMDMEDLQAAQDWNSAILQGVQFCDNLAFIISPDSVVSDPCREELECALRHNKKLIPLYYRDTPHELIHPALKELQWIFLRSQDDFQAGLGKMIQIIDAPKAINLSDRPSAEIEVHDEEGTRTIALQRDAYIVGRKPQNNECGAIVVYDSKRNVSRQHLKLVSQHGIWFARDESLNGISLFPPSANGRLSDGTKIFLGRSACLIYKEIVPRQLPPTDEHPTMGGE